MFYGKMAVKLVQTIVVLVVAAFWFTGEILTTIPMACR